MADGGGPNRRMQEVERRFHQPIAVLLERWYWEEQLTSFEVARKAGIAPRTARYWLKRYGLTLRQRAAAQRPSP